MKKYLLWAAVLLVVAFIWGNSLQDGSHSGRESRFVLALVKYVLAGVPDISHLTEGILRKMAHVSEYTALGFFLSCALSFTRWRWGRCTLVVGVLVALCDECLQIFSPGRDAELLDVCIDTSGILLGMGLAWLFQKLGRYKAGRGNAG